MRKQKSKSVRAMYADRNDTVEGVPNDAEFQGIGPVADQPRGSRNSMLLP